MRSLNFTTLFFPLATAHASELFLGDGQCVHVTNVDVVLYCKVLVHGVFPGVHGGWQPEEAHAWTHRRETVRLRDLWQAVCTVGPLEETPH